MIREAQDRAYEELLRIDREKEQEKKEAKVDKVKKGAGDSIAEGVGNCQNLSPQLH